MAWWLSVKQKIQFNSSILASSYHSVATVSTQQSRIINTKQMKVLTGFDKCKFVTEWNVDLPLIVRCKTNKDRIDWYVGPCNKLCID